MGALWRRYDIAVAGTAFFSFIVLVTLFASVVAPYDPMGRNIKNRFAPPSAEYAFGTDQLGRDVFSRVIHGGRPILSSSLAAVVAALLSGTLIGVAGGYIGGSIDTALMRLMDVMLSFPSSLVGDTDCRDLGRRAFECHRRHWLFHGAGIRAPGTVYRANAGA